MSHRDDIVYVQFHPLVFLVKLHIEMKIADLIAKVAREPGTQGPGWTRAGTLRRQSEIEMQPQCCCVDAPVNLGGSPPLPQTVRRTSFGNACHRTSGRDVQTEPRSGLKLRSYASMV